MDYRPEDELRHEAAGRLLEVLDAMPTGTLRIVGRGLGWAAVGWPASGRRWSTRPTAGAAPGSRT
jgi:hypothetical protein